MQSNTIMKSAIYAAIVLILAGCASTPKSSTDYSFTQGYPSADAAKAAQDDADFQRAVTAYRFWYPTISCEGIFEGGRQAGIKDNEKMIMMACTPHQVAFTPNSDTPYGAGNLDLTDGPFVIEIPPGHSSD
jgi:hypothetical protein